MRAAFVACLCAVSAANAMADSVLEADVACIRPYNQHDYERAVPACLNAAEHGDVESQIALANLYRWGEVGYYLGVSNEPNDQTAMSWFKRAADQGNRRAQFEVGQSYAEGWGVPQDYLAAAKWYQLSADQGNAKAQLYLGVLYEYGRGVTQDYVQAYKWYALSAAAVPSNPKWQANKNRDRVARKLTEAQFSEAQRLVQEWTPH